MFLALEKRLAETVPLSTHNTCIRHQRNIVIEPNICFGRSKNQKKNRLTETVPLSTHNMFVKTHSFSEGLTKSIRICFEDVLGCPIIIFIFGRLYFC